MTAMNSNEKPPEQPSAKDVARALVGTFDVRSELTVVAQKGSIDRYLGL